MAVPRSPGGPLPPRSSSAVDNMDDDIGVTVELYVYDLTRGMAAMMSQMLLGRQLDGIWHTAIVVYGREYFFGSGGVQSCRPCGTVLGEPDRVVELGETFIPYQVFLEYILGLGETTYGPNTYDLFGHNCNNFTDEVSQFLCGKGIPKYILDVPQEVLSTPWGQALRPLIDSLSEGARGVAFGQNADNSLRNYEPQDPRPRLNRDVSPDLDEINSAIEEVRRNSIALEERRNEINEKLAKKERKKKKKREKGEKGEKKEKRRIREEGSPAEYTPDSGSGSGESGRSPGSSPRRSAPPECSPARSAKMADGEEGADIMELRASLQDDEGGAGGGAGRRDPDEVAAEILEQERKEREERRKKEREPPVVFKDAVDVQAEFDAFVGFVEGALGPEEQQSLEELHQYMLEDEGSWALGDGFLNFVGRLLHDKSLKAEIRVKLLNILAAAALKDDVILILHQDRREHVLMNYAHDVDRLTPEEQDSLALFICNMFENLSSSEWLLYISEWQYCNTTISNIRVTTKVAVHSLLSDRPALQDRGSAIIHNLACKEVFDDVAVELTMALLQFFNSNPPEEQLYRCMKALSRFCQISKQDVPQLIQMIGPEPSKFKGASARIDKLIESINTR